MKLFGVLFLALLAQFSAVEGTKKQVKQAIKEMKAKEAATSYHYRLGDKGPKLLLCGECRSKTNQDIRQKCVWNTGECVNFGTEESPDRCTPGKRQKG